MPCMFCGEPTLGWVGMCPSCEELEYRAEQQRFQEAEAEAHMYRITAIEEDGELVTAQIELGWPKPKLPYEPPTMTRIESVEVITLSTEGLTK